MWRRDSWTQPSVDRGIQGLKRSLPVDAAGIPLSTVTGPVPPHDSPVLAPTLEVPVRTDAAMTIHLDRGYDSARTRQFLIEHGLRGDIAARGTLAPIAAGACWVVERTTAWTNAHKKLVWYTERQAAVIAFWIALSAAIILVGRRVREAWTRYRWQARPCREP